MTHPLDDDLEHVRVFHPDADEDLNDQDIPLESRPELDEVMARFVDGEYPRSALAGLSDLSPGEGRTLKAIWPQVAVDVRRGIASELQDLTQERFDYSFTRAIQTLVDDPDATVRQRAVAGLWEWDDPDVAQMLVSVLKHDESEDVRAAAAHALGPFAEIAELEELDDETAETIHRALTDVLADTSEPMHVRARCLESAAVFGLDETIHEAIAFFFDEEDTGFRGTAIFSMGRSLKKEYLPTVLNETASDDPELRFEAARAAGRFGEASALDVLSGLGRDEDAEVRHAAIMAMGEIGGNHAVRYLQRLSENANEAEMELIEAAIEEATIFSDPLLLDDEL
jgi:HEAT repeat protein